ncbi:MAG TPA: hypothetical protein H9811_09685 [Candidatus Gemmiger excrementigallinarum]|uniref:Uncharacterized protein n=1 Tax=Candidatus Gemmiger excrementigallinarum TaxID=2838609 RepID=A0A9D2JAS8_9FIRM|nr:hypothetical protein [Candidatus Gemmiger excrementigallinarum]
MGEHSAGFSAAITPAARLGVDGRVTAGHRPAKAWQVNFFNRFYGLTGISHYFFERANGPRSTKFIIYSLLFIISSIPFPGSTATSPFFFASHVFALRGKDLR